MFPYLQDIAWRILWETWKVFQEAGIFILFGFVMAGLIHAFVSAATIIRYMGKGRYRSIFWASILGIPMPLCSCSVLPAALSLRKRGAGNGATVAFLISTPECDVDTIFYTYGLMGPVMAFFRPFASFFTAMVAGSLVEYLRPQENEAEPSEEDVNSSVGDACCAQGDSALDNTDACCGPEARELVLKEPWYKRCFGYAFGEFMDETAHWILLGLVLSGVVSALLPPTFVENYLGQGILPLLIMLIIGIPLYTCATSSTPIAAVLMLKGLSPGAALVFLLAGPATNIGAIVLLTKFLGRRVVAIYLSAILVCTLGMGLILDAFYAGAGINPVAQIQQGWELIPTWLELLGAWVFMGLLLRSILRVPLPVEWRQLGSFTGRLFGIRCSARTFGIVIIALLLLLYLSSMFIAVEPGQAAVVRRFGAVHEPALGPGLHFRLPPPIDRVMLVQTDLVRQLEIGYRSFDPPKPPFNLDSNPHLARQDQRFQPNLDESLMMTGDGAFAEIRYNVQYQVVDPIAYALRAADTEALIRETALAAGLITAATRAIADAFGDSRADAEETIHRRTEALLKPLNLGVRIVRINLIYVHAPGEVHDEYRDYASALHDEKTDITNALGQAAETVQIAEASATALLNRAHGEYARETELAQGRAAALDTEGRIFETQPLFNEYRARLNIQANNLAGRKKIAVSPKIDPRRLEIVVLPEEKNPGGAGLNRNDLIIQDNFSESRANEEMRRRLESQAGGGH